MDFLSTDWENLLDLKNKNPDNSFNRFIKHLNSLLDVYAPTKKLTNKQIKTNLKPWITSGIKKSIIARDNLLRLFIKCKDNTQKSILHNQYKTYRNSIVNLIRKSKQTYFTKYFQKNSKNSKKIWQEINEYLYRNKTKKTIT